MSRDGPLRGQKALRGQENGNGPSPTVTLRYRIRFLPINSWSWPFTLNHHKKTYHTHTNESEKVQGTRCDAFKREYGTLQMRFRSGETFKRGTSVENDPRLMKEARGMRLPEDEAIGVRYPCVIRCPKINRAKTSLKHEEIKLLEDQTQALTPKKSNQVNKQLKDKSRE
ncbi:hypothetical protein L1987_58046 [Smallanthus sonchifolius]|uniref:Uncharacterized protein n=1 Tax=Smallanthus sonchifolius TaxID=185202 RepID=A0ACB9DF01_9ASTR|nr:hypothetical protein L1987_58046 [Smallanthus sonchifolius]